MLVLLLVLSISTLLMISRSRFVRNLNLFSAMNIRHGLESRHASAYSPCCTFRKTGGNALGFDVTFKPILAIFFGIVCSSSAVAQVSAKFITTSESVDQIRVVVRLDHAPGWHTYWSNPGTGQATKIYWTLPEGWAVGEIAWPVPTLIRGKDGQITGHGYEGTVYLPVTLMATKLATRAEATRIRAKVNWLMCELENCIPGSADLPLRGALRLDPAAAVALSNQPMPYHDPSVSVRGTVSGDQINLTLAGVGPMREPHFFPASEIIWHDAAQRFEADGSEASLTARIDKYWEGPRDRLSGILAYTDASGKYRGLIVDTPLKVASSAATAATSDNLAIIIFALLGGLILNLMPCVLPVLSLKALSLAKSAAGDARRDGLHYAAGVVFTFALVGGTMLILRSMLGGVGWGFQLQNPYFVMFIALLMAGIGFNLSGLFEVSGGISGAGQGLIDRAGRARSFLTGALAVVVATPCTAPFMAAALGAALLASPVEALLIFVVLGLGMALPFIVLALWPKARTVLPKPGQWMVTFRRLLAFPMFATAIWLLWVLGSQRSHDAMALGLIAILALGFLLWAVEHWAAQRRAGWMIATAIGTIALALPIVAIRETSAQQADAASTQLFEETAYTPTALEAALASGQPVFAYFTADWCVTCKVNERVAIHTGQTAQLFQSKKVRVLVGDWTNQNDTITQILSRYGRAGVPLYLYFPPGAGLNDAKVLPQLLTPNSIALAMDKQQAELQTD